MAHSHAHGHGERMLGAFLFNLGFAVFELLGGLFTGSFAILSDALHDVCDAASIGFSYFCERKIHKGETDVYTYGYARFSLLGTLSTTLILILGSGFICYHAFCRLFVPVEIKSEWMLVVAALGFLTNLIAARMMHGGKSLNERAVTLHLLEDVASWGLVLFGSAAIYVTKFYPLDSILSILSSSFVCIFAVRTLLAALDIFLEKAPHGMNRDTLANELMKIEGVCEIRNLRIWALDETRLCATMTLVHTKEDAKLRIKQFLKERGFAFVTVETEKEADA